MSSSAAPAPSLVPARESLDQKYTWDLSSIFTSWDAWEQAFTELDRGIEAYKKYEGTLAQGGDQLLKALTDRDALAQLSYKVWYYPSLQYDEDQRNNTINARRQRVQLLIAKWQQATSWFQPELLKLPLATVRQWMDATPAPGRLSLRDRRSVPSAGARAERAGRETAVADRAARQRAEGFVRRAVDCGCALSDDHAVDRRNDAGQLRAVSKAARDLPIAGRSPPGLRSALRHLHREPEHLRGDLQRRDARRLVRGARARLPDHARRRALRQRDSDQRASRT